MLALIDLGPLKNKIRYRMVYFQVTRSIVLPLQSNVK